MRVYREMGVSWTWADMGSAFSDSPTLAAAVPIDWVTPLIDVPTVWPTSVSVGVEPHPESAQTSTPRHSHTALGGVELPHARPNRYACACAICATLVAEIHELQRQADIHGIDMCDYSLKIVPFLAGNPQFITLHRYLHLYF